MKRNKGGFFLFLKKGGGYFYHTNTIIMSWDGLFMY